MRTQSLAFVLAALAVAASAQDVITTVEDSQNLTTGLYRVFLGYGRSATVTPVTISGSAMCDGTVSGTAAAVVSVRLSYIGNGTEEGGLCVPPTRGSSECVWTVKANSSLSDFVNSSDATVGSATTLKSASASSFLFFAEYTIGDLATCTGTTTVQSLTLTWTASSTDPMNGFCVRPQDSTELLSGADAPAIDYFATGADLPRESNNKFVLETRFVPASTPDTYFDLGLGNQLEFSCLNIFKSPESATGLSGCGYETGVDVVTLIDIVECNEFASTLEAPYQECCSLTTEATCSAWLDSSLGNACAWIKGTCYPTMGMGQVDITSIDTTSLAMTSSEKQATYSFSAVGADGPLSDYLQLDEKVFDANRDNVGSRRWFLKFSSGTSITDCNQFVTFSFKSDTTGGLCEPSVRKFCDSQMEKCMRSDPSRYGRYWRWSEPAATITSDYLDGEYKTCNCLKQKEVCYRKNGCGQSKVYDLVLMNCLDQGCGNWCSP